MICIEAYRSAVGLWQNSSVKKQNQPLVKENRGGDSFAFVEPGPNDFVPHSSDETTGQTGGGT